MAGALEKFHERGWRAHGDVVLLRTKVRAGSRREKIAKRGGHVSRGKEWDGV